MDTRGMFPIEKGKTIYIELTSTEDTDFVDCEMLSKIYAGKLKIDNFECQAIQIKGTIEEKVKNEVHSKLTSYLLDNNMLDTDHLNNIAANGSGFR